MEEGALSQQLGGSTEGENANQRPLSVSLVDLPTELLFIIVEALLEIGTLRDVASLLRTCSSIAFIAKDDFFWRLVYCKKFGESRADGISWFDKCKLEFSTFKRCGNKFVDKLEWACKRGHISLFESLFRRHTSSITNKRKLLQLANISLSGGKCDRPLLLATSCGHARLTQFLLEFGANPFQCDFVKNTPLIHAASSGSVETCRLLLTHVLRLCDAQGGSLSTYVNHPNHSGFTALHEAASYGHADVVELLINAGADVNINNSAHFRPAFSANYATVLGTPLHLAVANRRTAAVRALIAHGADLNATDPHGLQPMQLAARLGYVQGVVIALANGLCPVDNPIHRVWLALILKFSDNAFEEGADGLSREDAIAKLLSGSFHATMQAQRRLSSANVELERDEILEWAFSLRSTAPATAESDLYAATILSLKRSVPPLPPIVGRPALEVPVPLEWVIAISGDIKRLEHFRISNNNRLGMYRQTVFHWLCNCERLVPVEVYQRIVDPDNIMFGIFGMRDGLMSTPLHYLLERHGEAYGKGTMEQEQAAEFERVLMYGLQHAHDAVGLLEHTLRARNVHGVCLFQWASKYPRIHKIFAEALRITRYQERKRNHGKQ